MTDITLHLQSYNLDSDSPFTTIKYFVHILFFEEFPLQTLTTLVCTSKDEDKAGREGGI